jgi:hypothetical protein
VSRTPPAATNPTLPANRAFVVHFGTGASAAGRLPVGRVEHVVSGATARFESWEDLRRFVEQVLRSTNGGIES